MNNITDDFIEVLTNLWILDDPIFTITTLGNTIKELDT